MFNLFKKKNPPVVAEIPKPSYTEDELRDKCLFYFKMPEKVFSIERVEWGLPTEHTIIGYFGPDNNVKEWFLYCSRAAHNKIVEQHKIS